jgi:CheY-like chemotaxis protein
LSGHALTGFQQSAQQAGCDAFVTKPCLPDALVAEVERLLASPNARRSRRKGASHA